MKHLLLILTTMALTSCNYPQYKDDFFVGSASAQSPEAPLWVHGKACTDLDGKIGFCVVHHERTIPIELTLPAMPVGGDAELSCTGQMYPTNPHLAVVPGTPTMFTVTPADWGESVNVFACSIVFTPASDMAPIYGRVYVALFASKYLGVETPTLMDNRVMLGQYARFAWVSDSDGIKQYDKVTVSHITKTPKYAVVMTTQGRVSYASF